MAFQFPPPSRRLCHLKFGIAVDPSRSFRRSSRRFGPCSGVRFHSAFASLSCSWCTTSFASTGSDIRKFLFLFVSSLGMRPYLHTHTAEFQHELAMRHSPGQEELLRRAEVSSSLPCFQCPGPILKTVWIARSTVFSNNRNLASRSFAVRRSCTRCVDTGVRVSVLFRASLADVS